MEAHCTPAAVSRRIRLRIRAHPAALGRAGCGVLLLAAPRAVLVLAHDDPGDRRARGFVRLLGARHLGEGMALTLWPDERLLGFTAASDLAHAASVAILAWRIPAHRRPLVINGATALALALLTLAQLGEVRVVRALTAPLRPPSRG